MKRDNSYLVGNKHALGSGGNHTSFKKGGKPWNKGLHQITSPESLKTTFKKGQKAPNLLAVGTITVRTDKNGRMRRWIKVSDTQPRWTIYAQWLWIKHRGGIPTGLIVHHIDGDSLNDSLSNYCLVTRAQHIDTHRRELEAAKKK